MSDREVSGGALLGYVVLCVVLLIGALLACPADAQSFTASKTVAESPMSTTLTWSIPGNPKCTAGSTPGWSGEVLPSGTKNLSGVTKKIRLTLSCVTPGASTPVLLSWAAPTHNRDGSALTNLGGYRIAYSKDTATLNQTIDVPVPAATAYSVKDLAAGTYFFTVSALTQPCFQSPIPANCYASMPSNQATKTVTASSGVSLPVLTIDLEPYTVPKAPTNLAAQDGE